jgi:hypothetical protein
MRSAHHAGVSTTEGGRTSAALLAVNAADTLHMERVAPWGWAPSTLGISAWQQRTWSSAAGCPRISRPRPPSPSTSTRTNCCSAMVPPAAVAATISEGQSESQQGGGARRKTVLRVSNGALRPDVERMAGCGGRYLPAGRCTAGVTIPPISGQGQAEASLEIDPTTDRAPDCMQPARWPQDPSICY